MFYAFLGRLGEIRESSYLIRPRGPGTDASPLSGWSGRVQAGLRQHHCATGPGDADKVVHVLQEAERDDVRKGRKHGFELELVD